MDICFTLRPVESKPDGTRLVVVVVYRDARVAPRVESHITRYGKVTQRHVLGVGDRFDIPRDRVAVYVVECGEKSGVLKSGLRNMASSRDFEVVIGECLK